MLIVSTQSHTTLSIFGKLFNLLCACWKGQQWQHWPLELSVTSSQAGRQPTIWTYFKCDDFCRRLGQNKSDCDTKRRYNFFVCPNPIKLNAASRRQQLGSDWQTAAAESGSDSGNGSGSSQGQRLHTASWQGFPLGARCCKDCEHMPPAGASPDLMNAPRRHPLVRRGSAYFEREQGCETPSAAGSTGVGSCLGSLKWPA